MTSCTQGQTAAPTSAAFSLAGELALITGGGSGLGLATARCMAAAGTRVILTGRNAAQLERAAQSIGEHAVAIPHDVTRTGDTPALIDSIRQRFGAVTILVNNAGIHLKKPAVETEEHEFANVLNTHILGAHALSRAVAPGMIARRAGSIVYIASMASLFGIPNVVAYSAAKSACLGIVRTLATEWSPHGVRVNAIAPGWIDSDMMRGALAGDPARSAKILNRTPMGRFGNADDIGWAAVYLSSPAARFVTGATLPVDGGVSIGF